MFEVGIFLQQKFVFVRINPVAINVRITVK